MNENNPRSQSDLMVYFCGRENCRPGLSFGPAVRPHYLLHVILDGKGIFKYKEKTYHLKKGDAFLIPPMVTTYYEADFSTPWRYAWVGFDGKVCQNLLENTILGDSCVYLNPDPENLSLISGYMDNLTGAFAESPENFVETAGWLLLLLSCMANLNRTPRLDSGTAYFERAREFIMKNYADSIQVSDIARHLGIDRTYLYRIFMEHENISPKQYLLQHRLRIATEMLYSTDSTITEIALACGFKDPAAFGQYFRQAVGSTPRDYRKAFRKKVDKMPTSGVY